MSREEWKQHVKDSVQFIDPFEGVTDPIDILAIKYRKKTKGSFWLQEKACPYTAVELCERLSKSDEPTVTRKLIALVDDKKSRIANEIAADITRYTDLKIDSFLLHLLELGKQFGEVSYLGASPNVRDALISTFANAAASDNLLLTSLHLNSLAWIGDDEVASLFSQWLKHPPEWSLKLNWPLNEHPHIAGWETKNNGTRRDLFFTDCFPVLPQSTINKGEAIGIVFTRTNTHCPWCNAPLICLFDVPKDQAQECFSLQSIQIAMCEFCIFECGVLYWESKPRRLSLRRGDAHPSTSNHQGRDPMIRKALPISRQQRNPYYSCAPFPESPSQLGGFPSWLQDPEFPKCVSCNETMKFIGQAVHDDSSDTIFYAFICEQCPDIAATSVQYT